LISVKAFKCFSFLGYFFQKKEKKSGKKQTEKRNEHKLLVLVFMKWYIKNAAKFSPHNDKKNHNHSGVPLRPFI
jgi:hypothetical protein